LQSIPNSSAALDPAINSPSHLIDTLSLGELSITEAAVYIFDFDGVISSRMDDDIYKLAPTADEIPILLAAAECFGIRCDGMEQRYQRHLLYQAAAWCLRIPIEPGPAFLQAMDSGKHARLFILTARSGWHAVERLRNFVSAAGMSPIEIYNVGRVKKDRQVELICREFESGQVFYVEDSAAHLADAASIAFKNLSLVLVETTLQPERDNINLRQHFIETLNAALLVFRAHGDRVWPKPNLR
jgi:hypothetical protein